MTAVTPTFQHPAPGLVTLGPAEAELFELLDGLFVRIADELGADRMIGPALLPAGRMAELDYFRNFPHLGVVAAQLTEPAVAQAAAGTDPAQLLADGIRATGFILPSATCYGLLLSLAGQHPATELRLTATGRCFRNEQRYEGLRRLWGFHMREILYVGDRSGAAEHLTRSRGLIEELAGRLGLPLSVEPANDPFYDRDGSRARLTMLDPVKHEFLAVDGTAVASVNRHRNFFGERLDLRFGGEPAFSSCTAFGVERWVHALVLTHGSVGDALARVRRVDR